MPLRPQWIERVIRRALEPAADLLVRARVHPNALTTLGFFIGVAAALAFAQGSIRLGGFFLLVAGAFDIFDGRVARGTGLGSTFGAFYDSTLDRVSEIVVFVGLIAYFLGDGLAAQDAGIVYAIGFALGGSLMVSYTRARAEALGLDCTVGLMQRGERVFMLGVAALLFGAMWETLVLRGVIIVIAVLSIVTTFQRIHWVYRNTRTRPAERSSAAPRSNKLTGKSL